MTRMRVSVVMNACHQSSERTFIHLHTLVYIRMPATDALAHITSCACVAHVFSLPRMYHASLRSYPHLTNRLRT